MKLKRFFRLLPVAAALASILSAKANAATTVRVCPGIQTLTSTSEIFLTANMSADSAYVASILIYNSAGTQLKSYTSTFPGTVTASQPLNATQSFTLSSIFGTTNVGAVAIVISYSVSGSVIPANYPTAYFTQTFSDSSGNTIAKLGNYCVAQTAS